MIKKLRYCFLLVLLLHLLLLFSFTVVLSESDLLPSPPTTPEEDAENKAEKVLPSYVFQQQIKQVATPDSTNNMPASPAKPQAANGILKTSALTPTQHNPQRNVEEQAGYHIREESGGPKNDGTTIIADRPTDKPLIKLLSRATAAKLRYPKSAQDFQITGTVHLGFNITPAGIVSNVKVIHSSGSNLLDQAALTAISSISPVNGVEPYLPEARYLTVGIIFGF